MAAPQAVVGGQRLAAGTFSLLGMPLNLVLSSELLLAQHVMAATWLLLLHWDRFSLNAFPPLPVACFCKQCLVTDEHLIIQGMLDIELAMNAVQAERHWHKLHRQQRREWQPVCIRKVSVWPWWQLGPHHCQQQR